MRIDGNDVDYFEAYWPQFNIGAGFWYARGTDTLVTTLEWGSYAPEVREAVLADVLSQWVGVRHVEA